MQSDLNSKMSLIFTMSSYTLLVHTLNKYTVDKFIVAQMAFVYDRVVSCIFDISICFSKFFPQQLITSICYSRPILQAWLLPNLNTIPDNCIKENSL